MTTGPPRIASHLPEHRSLMVGLFDDAEHPEHVGHRDNEAPLMIHPHAAIVLMLRGRSTMWCGSTYTLEPGHVLILPEGTPHYGVERDDVLLLGMAVCASCLSGSAAGARLAEVIADVARGASAQRVLSKADADRLRWVLESLQEELEEPRPHQPLAIEGYLSLVATILSRTATQIPADAAPVSVSARALAYIGRYATTGISLADVARHVYRSTAHTAAVVKKDTGRTVVGWITYARLATARELLLRTDDTIEAIAERVGFASASHFHRTFRKHHETTPANWRRAHRQRTEA